MQKVSASLGLIVAVLEQQPAARAQMPRRSAGDTVILYTMEKSRAYKVFNKMVVLPTAIEVVAPTDEETLTLITCYPDWVYTHRMIVQARPVSGDQGDTAGGAQIGK